MTEPRQAALPAFQIVVVDDDPAQLLSITHLLRKEGWTVTEAASGTEGDSLIREIRPDLVLMDVNLGDADGRELCKSLKGDPDLKNTFFVLMSNVMTTTDDQVRGLSDGADGYIVRPVENRELLARVKAFLRIAAAAHEVRETLDALSKSRGENLLHIAELERFNKAAVGRELRMIKLKQEVNALCRELGRDEPYA